MDGLFSQIMNLSPPFDYSNAYLGLNENTPSFIHNKKPEQSNALV